MVVDECSFDLGQEKLEQLKYGGLVEFAGDHLVLLLGDHELGDVSQALESSLRSASVKVQRKRQLVHEEIRFLGVFIVHELLDRVVNWVGILVLLGKQATLSEVVLVAGVAEVEGVAVLK